MELCGCSTTHFQTRGAKEKGFLFLYVVGLSVFVRSLNEYFARKIPFRKIHSYVTITVFYIKKQNFFIQF